MCDLKLLTAFYRHAIGIICFIFYDTRLKCKLGSFGLSHWGKVFKDLINGYSIYLCFSVFYYGLYYKLYFNEVHMNFTLFGVTS